MRIFLKIFSNFLNDEKNHPDQIPDIFKNPPVYDGAIEAVNQLYESNLYDLFNATSPSWNNAMRFTHKRLWIEKYFGQIFKKNVHYSQKRFTYWRLFD